MDQAYCVAGWILYFLLGRSGRGARKTKSAAEGSADDAQGAGKWLPESKNGRDAEAFRPFL